MTLISIAALIVSIIAITKSNDALRQVADLKNGSVMPASPQPAPQAAPVASPEAAVVPSAVPAAAPDAPQAPSAFVAWLKEDWLLKLGGALVLMGVLFFLAVAFQMVGPQGKIILGYLLGALLMAFGFWLAKKYASGGSAIHLIGALVVIITTYVAKTPAYNIFDGFVAMAVMFLTSVLVALTAFAYSRQSLAVAGLVMASLVPVLVGSGTPDMLETFVYLCVVIVGVLVLAIVTQWRVLVLISQIILCLYSAAFGGVSAFTNGGLETGEILMIVVFGFLFFITSVFSILRSQGATARIDGWIALLNGFYAFGWIIAEVPAEMQAIALAFVALLYALAFFAVYKVTDELTSFVVYGGVAFGMLVSAVMVELSGPAETIALILIASGATSLTAYLSKTQGVTKAMALTHLLPLFGVLDSIGKLQYHISMNNYPYRDTFAPYEPVWPHFAVVLIAMTSYALLAAYLKDKTRSFAIGFAIAAALLAVVAVWQALHILISGNLPTFISLVIYTITGLGVMARGVSVNSMPLVKVGKLVLGLVALRVLFIDAWTLGSTTIGILVCIVVGLLLLSSTLITKKLATQA